MFRSFQVAKVFLSKEFPRRCLRRSPKRLLVHCFATKSEETFINGTNAAYVEYLFNSWLRDPSSVHASWDAYFRNNVEGNLPNIGAFPNHPMQNMMPTLDGDHGKNVNFLPIPDLKSVDDHFEVHSMIRAYQVRGHELANLNPLSTAQRAKDKKQALVGKIFPNFCFGENEMDQLFKLPNFTYIGGGEAFLPLREIVSRLEKIYCEKIGLEFAHIPDEEQQNWIKERFETPAALTLTDKEKRTILINLIAAVGLENFLAKKFSSEKRFGIEGCEMMIPALKEIISVSTKCGVESVIFGMAHRGRLNTLVNVCSAPLKQVLSQFINIEAADDGTGDVKYHLGIYTEQMNKDTNKTIRLSVLANPSHLEAVDPVVLGKTRAEQVYCNDQNGEKIMSVLVHGDAAFSGQGVVYESMQLSALPEFTTHGTIHFITNNQIGFTTDPIYLRSSPYCTDVAKVISAPVFHVNADDPEAVIYVSRVAAHWRATFHKDVVIDLVGYRRHGHNEIDEPMFTQPTMYKQIGSHRTVLDSYKDKLIGETVTNPEEVATLVKQYDGICEEALELTKKSTHFYYKDWLDTPWSSFFENRERTSIFPTGVDMETLVYIGLKFSNPPEEEDFQLHKGVTRILTARKEMIAERLIDWALAEAMAFGSLLKEGIHVRLSGQDVERGTFSHRHHVIHDQQGHKKPYNSLQNLYPKQAIYTICNSCLSEYAVLGFEHGYSLTSPYSLVLWEAQFGDFFNTAQCIIDQFISSGQAKWVRQSGLVLLLPHGMEGMGPEHSSGRIERFLQMSSDDPDFLPSKFDNFCLEQLRDNNWIVANCSTPANYFHILRRQVALPFRKPLILFTPKSLLRLPEAKSPLQEMCEDTEFQRIIPDDGPATEDPTQVERVIFCSGRVYYDLKKIRDENELQSKIALVRIEQISPFPFDLVKEQIDLYPYALILWTQEEHKNQGCWNYVRPRFMTILPPDRIICYSGRQTSASTATGSKAMHLRELTHFLKESISLL